MCPLWCFCSSGRIDPSDQHELEPHLHIQSEFIGKDAVFEYLRLEGLSVNNLDSEQLTVTSTTPDHNNSLTSRLLLALSSCMEACSPSSCVFAWMYPLKAQQRSMPSNPARLQYPLRKGWLRWRVWKSISLLVRYLFVVVVRVVVVRVVHTGIFVYQDIS